MARWKKIIVTVALLLVVLIVALYAFLSLYDFNKFKPMIAKAVKDAVGRDLKIAGDIEFELGIRPTLIVEDVSFQNAAWSSTPDLAQVKRLEAQVALLPLITGKFDFAHLVLIEPAVIVEFDGSGTNNFEFDTLSNQNGETSIPPPPLIFSDVLIKKGLFTFKDPRSDFNFSVRIDRLEAEIPGFDESLQVNFEGAFNDHPLALKGTVGPIWAWVEPGYALPLNLTAMAGGTTATIAGELRDAINFKDLAFEVTARGPSVAEINRLAGISDVPEFGAFKLSAKVSDSTGSLAVEKLDVQIGSPELVAISLSGSIQDVFVPKGVNLEISTHGQDSSSLSQLGLPALPERGPFRVTARISDPEPKVYSVSDLRLVWGENEFDGQIDLSLAEKVPVLIAGLASQRFRFGKLKLDLKIAGPFAKPAIQNIDLKIGYPDLAKIQLSGKVDDLLELQGVNVRLEASGKDLANLAKLTGQPFPLRGVFMAAGQVLIPAHKNLKVPDLKITVGKNKIAGSLDLNLRGSQPQLAAKLSLPKLDLPSVLLPELAKQGWAKGLGLISPVKLGIKLGGFIPEVVIQKIDLRAGTLKSAELRLSGSVTKLIARRGIDLEFSLRGNDASKIKDITGQPYFFAPVPGQGRYAISGHISDPTASIFKIENFRFAIADTDMTGRLIFNLAAEPPIYEADISTTKFNLKWFPLPEHAVYAELNKIDDLGPLRIQSKVAITGDGLSLQKLVVGAGTKKLALIDVKGSIKNFTKQTGINLNFNIRGNEVANLKKITGRTIPLKGAYSLSGKLTDPAPKKFKLKDLKLKLGKNNISGSLDLNLSGKKLELTTALAAPQFTLQPVTLPPL